MDKNYIRHPFPPVFDGKSEILILGSFPSAKSREQLFFYGHPQNRFWKVLAAVFDAPLPGTTEEKKAFLLANHLAVWDSVAACEIIGSSDASIRNVTPNDLSQILSKAPIREICCNGTASHTLYEKYIYPLTGRHALKLPSTSPANAAWTLEKLISAWETVRERML